ncbi:hypothetical protein Pelo_17698 [Pelomyxa schiedti]|nr:hypothetical protein Pelo_17698 [Pelomyxa schiedti]
MYHNSGNVVVSNANYQQQAGIVGGGAPIMGPVDPGFQQQMMMSTTPQPPTTVGPANRVMGKGLLIVDGPFFTAAVGGRDVSLDLFVQSIESRVGTLFLDKIYKRARMPTFGWQTLDCTPRSSRSEILCPECSFKYNFSGGALDVEIAVTVLDSGAFNDDIQEIVLVVGDGDYYSAVEKAKTKYNKHIWVVHEHETANTRLIALAGARKIPLETWTTEIPSTSQAAEFQIATKTQTPAPQVQQQQVSPTKLNV